MGAWWQEPKQTNNKWQRHHHGHHWGKRFHAPGVALVQPYPCWFPLSRVDTFPMALVAFTHGVLLGPQARSICKVELTFSQGRNGCVNKARQRLKWEKNKKGARGYLLHICRWRDTVCLINFPSATLNRNAWRFDPKLARQCRKTSLPTPPYPPTCLPRHNSTHRDSWTSEGNSHQSY